jgi:uncharacterized protein YndB with AHSA1/START domain
MKWFLLVLVVLFVMVEAAWILGRSLPREHRAASRITLRSPADKVWTAVRDLGALKGTWSALKAAARVTDAQGREVWEETVSGFKLRLIVAESDPPRRLVTNVDAPSGAAFGGRWVYELVPSGNSTTVTVAEEGWIGPGPYRLMSKLTGYHKSIDQYLTALGQHFGESVTPEHVQ